MKGRSWEPWERGYKRAIPHRLLVNSGMAQCRCGGNLPVPTSRTSDLGSWHPACCKTTRSSTSITSSYSTSGITISYRAQRENVSERGRKGQQERGGERMCQERGERERLRQRERVCVRERERYREKVRDK